MSKKEELAADVNRFLHKMPWDWFTTEFTTASDWDVVLINMLQALAVGAAGWLLATWLERRHFMSMGEREIPLQSISVNTAKNVPSCEPEGVTLLIGSVVVAHDYFRTLLIFLRKIIGGNIRHYERLVQRGRREALIRLKEEAELRGIDKVVNVRFTTSAVSGRFLHAIEMVAYGTGVKTNMEIDNL